MPSWILCVVLALTMFVSASVFAGKDGGGGGGGPLPVLSKRPG